MKKLTTLAVALILPMLFVSVPAQAQMSTSCQTQLQELIDATKQLCACNPKESAKLQNKLLKNLYKAQDELCKGGTKHQYHAAMDVWKYDSELRKEYQKGKISCDDGAALDEGALQLLICIVDMYYPDYEYNPYANGVISCP